MALTSRLASTFSTPSIRSRKMGLIITDTSAYSIRHCIIRRLWKSHQRLACFLVRTFGAIASVVGQSKDCSDLLRLSRGSLPALTSCSQLTAVRSVLFLTISIFIYCSPVLVQVLPHIARYLLMLILYPWLLHLCVLNFIIISTERKWLELVRLGPKFTQTSSSQRCPPTRKTRRGARGRGGEYVTAAARKHSGGWSPGKLQTTGPSHNWGYTRPSGPQTSRPAIVPSSPTSPNTQTNGTSSQLPPTPDQEPAASVAPASTTPDCKGAPKTKLRTTHDDRAAQLRMG